MDRRLEIEQTLSNALNPLHIEVVDESHMHSVPEGAQSHFKVTVVADAFADQRLLQRHRRVNELLREQMANGIHALALHTMTPEEWFEKGVDAPQSPPCLGGSKQP